MRNLAGQECRHPAGEWWGASGAASRAGPHGSALQSAKRFPTIVGEGPIHLHLTDEES